MRLALLSVVALAVSLWVGSLFARPSSPLAAPIPAGEPAPLPEYEVRFADDSVVKVAIADPQVVLVTKYGRLTIPMVDVRRVDFGMRYPPGVEAWIEKAIGELGSPDYETRETADKTLAGFEHLSLKAVKKAAKSSDPEVSRRAENLIRKLESTLSEEKLELREYDLVETPEFTARGHIELAGLKARSRHLGDLNLKLTDLINIRAISGGSKSDVTLDAAIYAKPNNQQWLATSIEVSSGQPLEISVSGQIDLWPQQPGQYLASPDGMGNGFGGGGPNGLGGPGVRNGVGGQVVARIGQNGTQFTVGSSYKGKANGSGKLYLRINASPWGNDSSGSFKVKIGTPGG